MDLQNYCKSPKQLNEAKRVLNYQPFKLSDSIITGVAYSWLYDKDGGRRVYDHTEFVFDRDKEDPEVWEKASDANQRLANMYECFLDEIAARFPGCSLADMACNNGYFPIGAAVRGMGPCTGFDMGDYSASVSLLNKLTGSNVKFRHRQYDSWNHFVPGFKPHDVVIASQVMQHISDPLYFLSFVASRAKKALFLYTGMADTDDYRIYYADPNRFQKNTRFPNCFDNDVGLSRGLLFKSLDMLGFDEIIEIPWTESWLPQPWYGTQKALLCIRKERPYFHHHVGGLAFGRYLKSTIRQAVPTLNQIRERVRRI